MSDKWRIPRRTVLRGLGTAMALPLLDVMTPARAFASGAAKAAPNRLAFVFFPNGLILDDFWPKKEGRDFDFPYILEPLKPFKDDIQLLHGLAQDKARANGDGPGDHARCSATYLTGVQAHKTDGADIRLGISADQIAAQRVGNRTVLPSLELGIDAGRNVGRCDSGYSCAYVSNISWRSATQPMAKEVNPRLAFERLFGSGDSAGRERSGRDLYQKSILDLVRDDAKELERTLGSHDRRKIDEYFTSVREIELRVARAQDQVESDWTPAYEKPEGVPSDYDEHLKLMYDMMVLAFQGDVTRIATFMSGNAGDNRNYRAIGVPDGHHYLSHHGGDEEKVAQIRKIDRFLMEHFAYFLDKLKSVEEGDGTLLDHCMVQYGCAIDDGNRHSHHDLPIILGGKGCGTLETGRFVKYERDTPLNNLYLDLLDRMGVHIDGFGDSTGRLGNIGPFEPEVEAA